MIKTNVINSCNDGLHILILGAVHGNEKAGSKAIEKFLLEEHKLKSGKITFIAIANPKAYEENVREIDENLNRTIKHNNNPQNYEQRLGDVIASYIDECDVLLDLHSTHCEGEEPFVFCDNPNEGNLKIVKNLPVGYVITGWPEIYKDSVIEDFSTSAYANKHNKLEATVECGYHYSDDAKDVAYDCITNLLQIFEMIEGVVKKPKKQKFVNMEKVVIKEKEGKLNKSYKHLDFIKKGEKIAIFDDKTHIFAEKDCFILIPNHNAEVGKEWFYLGV